MRIESTVGTSSSRQLAAWALSILTVGTALGIAPDGAAAQQRATPSSTPTMRSTPFVPPPETSQPRLIALISDLHFGLGRRADGTWSPKEDFRWPDALAGFLKEIGRRGDDRVDLVIVGDFLELWQPPADVRCEGLGADAGCTIAEMVRIVEAIVAAHFTDLALLRDFAKEGENRLHIIPGNHDSALLLAAVWSPVAIALDESSGRIELVRTGVWKSPDGRIIAEHGHQVGNDVNRYPSWPRITLESGGSTYLMRPWGERFVQRMFNSQEDEYEIIDNIAPETVGVKYRIADRGYAKTAGDFAQFIAFNLFETSFEQKLAAAGRPDSVEAGSPDSVEVDRTRWDVDRARKEIGYKLFLDALDVNDPLRAAIEGSDGASQALKAALTALAMDENRLSNNDVRALCDHLALRDRPKCTFATAGAWKEADLVPRRHVIRDHVAGHLHTDPQMDIFVFGHTHSLDEGWPVTIVRGKDVTVHNTGAFQRTVDEKGFLARVQQRRLTAAQALRGIKLEELPPCYSAVLVTYRNGIPNSKTWRWHMPEGGTGSLVEPGDERCD